MFDLLKITFQQLKKIIEYVRSLEEHIQQLKKETTRITPKLKNLYLPLNPKPQNADGEMNNNSNQITHSPHRNEKRNHPYFF